MDGPPQASPWRKTRDREEERKAKRLAVLRTAAQIFNEKGFHATSLDEVAERLHVTKATLYYYVKSKDEILFECVRIGLERMKTAIAAVGRSGGRPVDKLHAAMRQYAEIVTMDFGMCLIRVGEEPLPANSRKELRRLKAQIDSEFRNLIAQGVADGSLAACDPKLAAFTLAGALSWIGRWYRDDGLLGPGPIAEQAIALLMNGLTARGEDARKEKIESKAKGERAPPRSRKKSGDTAGLPPRKPDSGRDTS